MKFGRQETFKSFSSSEKLLCEAASVHTRKQKIVKADVIEQAGDNIMVTYRSSAEQRSERSQVLFFPKDRPILTDMSVERNPRAQTPRE